MIHCAVHAEATGDWNYAWALGLARPPFRRRWTPVMPVVVACALDATNCFVGPPAVAGRAHPIHAEASRATHHFRVENLLRTQPRDYILIRTHMDHSCSTYRSCWLDQGAQCGGVSQYCRHTQFWSSKVSPCTGLHIWYGPKFPSTSIWNWP
jgi:hypothetical protein